MQSRLMVGVLVLQAEGLVLRSRYVYFALQFTLTVIIPEPNQYTVLIGHLTRDADLVAVEVVGLFAAFAFFGCPVVDLCQGFVCTSHALHQDWKFHTGYGFLTQSSGYFYYYYHCVSQYFFYVRIINLKFEIYSLSQGIF